jgi:hypothetical protein
MLCHALPRGPVEMSQAAGMARMSCSSVADVSNGYLVDRGRVPVVAFAVGFAVASAEGLCSEARREMLNNSYYEDMPRCASMKVSMYPFDLTREMSTFLVMTSPLNLLTWRWGRKVSIVVIVNT